LRARNKNRIIRQLGRPDSSARTVPAPPITPRGVRPGGDVSGDDCGPVNGTVVDAVEKLPYKVSQIYRRLTR
jgi:hypothetical protein